MLPHLVLTAGIGFPELVHLEVGGYAVPRLDLHLRAALPLLQPEIGVGVRGHFGPAEPGAAPRWAFTAAFDVSVNPTYLRVYEGGERLGMAFWPMAGGEYLAKSGFVARLEVGAVLGLESRDGVPTPGGGPNARLSLGWAWGPHP
jgi:hypothetical protein